MKLLCTQENLKNGIGIVEKIIGKNINLPILDNVLLEATEGKLKIASTNLEIGITCWIRSKIETKGAITIPVKIFSNFVSNLPSGSTIKIEEKNGIVGIESENYKANIKGIEAKDYPLIPQIEDEPALEINAQDLKIALMKVISASSLNDARPELTGIFMHTNIKDGQIKFAATDSFRLSESTIITKINKREDFSLIIPGKTAHEVIRIIGDSSESVKISNTESQILFNLGDIHIISRLINGNYPSYTQIIPNEFTTEFLVSKEELVKGLKMASFFAGSNNDVKINILKEKISISSSSSEVGDNITDITIENSGKEVELIFNYRYIIDGLLNIDSPQVKLMVSGQHTPTILKNEKNGNFLYLVMPIRG